MTKKTVFTIDLRKVTEVIDENDAEAKSKLAAPGTPSRADVDFDSDMGTMPRSFRLVFDDGDGILFWADSDEEKAGWCVVFPS